MELQIMTNRDRDFVGTKEEFWVICNESGVVSYCSNIAADHDIVSGKTHISQFVSKRDMPLVEDALRRIFAGADVSVTAEALPEIGCSIILVRSARFFSSFAAYLHFYTNREEYLAASDQFGERLGKVFDYIGDIASEIGSAVDELKMIPPDVSAAVDSRIKQLSDLNRRLVRGRDYVNLIIAEKEVPENSICDMSAVFNAVADMMENSEDLPFFVRFENRCGECKIICGTDPERYAEIILMIATVASRLSEDHRCTVALSGRDRSAEVEARCVLKKGYTLYGRSEDLGEIYRCISGNPVELMILERLVYVPEWKVEYISDGNGEIVLRASVMAEPNPDFFKYRDPVAGIANVFDQYRNYITGDGLSDPQKKSED